MIFRRFAKNILVGTLLFQLAGCSALSSVGSLFGFTEKESDLGPRRPPRDNPRFSAMAASNAQPMAAPSNAPGMFPPPAYGAPALAPGMPAPGGMPYGGVPPTPYGGGYPTGAPSVPPMPGYGAPVPYGMPPVPPPVAGQGVMPPSAPIPPGGAAPMPYPPVSPAPYPSYAPAAPTAAINTPAPPPMLPPTPDVSSNASAALPWAPQGQISPQERLAQAKAGKLPGDLPPALPGKTDSMPPSPPIAKPSFLKKPADTSSNVPAFLQKEAAGKAIENQGKKAIDIVKVEPAAEVPQENSPFWKKWFNRGPETTGSAPTVKAPVGQVKAKDVPVMAVPEKVPGKVPAATPLAKKPSVSTENIKEKPAPLPPIKLPGSAMEKKPAPSITTPVVSPKPAADKEVESKEKSSLFSDWFGGNKKQQAVPAVPDTKPVAVKAAPAFLQEEAKKTIAPAPLTPSKPVMPKKPEVVEKTKPVPISPAPVSIEKPSAPSLPKAPVQAAPASETLPAILPETKATVTEPVEKPSVKLPAAPSAPLKAPVETKPVVTEQPEPPLPVEIKPAPATSQSETKGKDKVESLPPPPPPLPMPEKQKPAKEEKPAASDNAFPSLFSVPQKPERFSEKKEAEQMMEELNRTRESIQSEQKKDNPSLPAPAPVIAPVVPEATKSDIKKEALPPLPSPPAPVLKPKAESTSPSSVAPVENIEKKREVPVIEKPIAKPAPVPQASAPVAPAPKAAAPAAALPLPPTADEPAMRPNPVPLPLPEEDDAATDTRAYR